MKTLWLIMAATIVHAAGKPLHAPLHQDAEYQIRLMAAGSISRSDGVKVAVELQPTETAPQGHPRRGATPEVLWSRKRAAGQPSLRHAIPCLWLPPRAETP